jgi:hypothetical protein
MSASPATLLAAAATSGTGTVTSSSFVAKLPATPDQSVSTIPSNGDLNPYGVATIPRGFLVTNFNNSQNLQGTGTTILRVGLDGKTTPFYQAPAGFGLTSAIGVMRKGFVFVGSVPTTDGSSATVQQGSLLVLNHNGQLIANLKNPKLLDGPWGMAVNDQGNHAQIFISNVLNGTITRLNVSIKDGKPDITSAVQIAKGYSFTTDPTALVVGPTGLAYNPLNGLLYVASTADNAIYVIPNAGSINHPVNKGVLVVQNNPNLHGPLGLAFAPNGDLLVTNGDAVNPPTDPTQASLLDEFTGLGQFVAQLSLDPAPGAAFGLALKRTKQGVVLATVNDDTNTLDLRTVPSGSTTTG